MTKNLFDSKEAKILWKDSEDAIRSRKFLSEIYCNVPKTIANVEVETLEFYRIDCTAKLKKKVLKWLNSND